MTKDTRRVCEGVRLHPYLGAILASGARLLRTRRLDLKFRNDQFNRAAIPLLAERGVISKFSSGEPIPDWMPKPLRDLINRDLKAAIWIPDLRAAGGEEDSSLVAMLEPSLARVERVLREFNGEQRAVETGNRVVRVQFAELAPQLDSFRNVIDQLGALTDDIDDLFLDIHHARARAEDVLTGRGQDEARRVLQLLTGPTTRAVKLLNAMPSDRKRKSAIESADALRRILRRAKSKTGRPTSNS